MRKYYKKMLKLIKKFRTHDNKDKQIESDTTCYPTDFFDGILYFVLAQTNDPLKIVQVGANDGKSNDPLFDFLCDIKNVRVLMVEPHPFAFEKLKQLYSEDSRIKLINKAVGEKPGTLELYCLNERYGKLANASKEKMTRLTTTRKDIQVKRINRKLKLPVDEAESLIDCFEIECEPLSNILKVNGFCDPDVILVDAEGYDDIIVRQLDLNYNKPMVINYEVWHLDSYAYTSLGYKLDDAGYMRIKHGKRGKDECAIRKL